MKKKIVSVVLSGAMLISGSVFAYDDLEGHWAKDYILDMSNAGVLDIHYDGQYFNPNKMMTREECAVLISGLFEQFYGYTPTYYEDNKKFVDLYEGERTDKIRALSQLYYRSVFTSPVVNYPEASIARIIEGYPSDYPSNVEFRPNNNVTRAEFSKMLVNALDCFGYLALGNPPQISTDADLHWGRGNMMIAHGLGIINGYYTLEGDYTMETYDVDNNIVSIPVSHYMELRPDGNITRAEAVKMVASAKDKMYHGFKKVDEGGTRPTSETQLYYID